MGDVSYEVTVALELVSRYSLFERRSDAEQASGAFDWGNAAKVSVEDEARPDM